MDWQQAVSLALVFVAAVLMVRGAIRKRARRAAACDQCALNPPRVKKVKNINVKGYQ